MVRTSDGESALSARTIAPAALVDLRVLRVRATGGFSFVNPARNTSKITPVAHPRVDPYDLHHVTGHAAGPAEVSNVLGQICHPGLVTGRHVGFVW